MHQQEMDDRNYIKYLKDQNNNLRFRITLMFYLVYGQGLAIGALLLVVIVG